MKSSSLKLLQGVLPLAILSIFGCVLLSACSQHVGESISVPEIPIEEARNNSRARLSTQVSLADFKDVRGALDNDNDSSEQPGNFTQPQGEVTRAVQKALETALLEKGVQVSGASKVSMWGEVRKWQANIHTTTRSKIISEASLFLELLDRDGKRVYSGTYHGSRASEFISASTEDIKYSLGLAMSQAIDQALADEELISALWSTN